MANNKKGSIRASKYSNLVIVESPAKIKTLSKFLGKDFKVTSTMGHVKDLPEKKIGVEVENKEIKIDYVPIKGKKTVISDICKLAADSEQILLASDPDREGEIISFHIGQEIEKVKDKSQIFRIVFNEITKPAVKKAIEDKHSIDLDKVSAQQARRILDRWVGYEVSPILWRKISKGLSAGRVQSVAVMLVCNRETEIQNFKPEESWSVNATFKNEKDELQASLYKIKNKKAELKDKKAADKVIEEAKKADFVISKITDKQKSKKPLAPFMTSSLQQDAYNKLGFSVSKTMTIAQKLYEGLPLGSDSPEALITYMRTDSLRLSNTALKDIRGYVSDKLGKEYLPGKSVAYSKGGAQDAHEAIRPISVYHTPESVKKHIEPDFAKLYELIWKRTVASQMTPALYDQKQILVDGGLYTFKSTGTVLKFDGFLKVYKPEEDKKEKEENKLSNKIQEKDSLNIKEISGKQHFTQPPPRYTEASLVKEMEKQGIGRPSTYSATLSTIQKRNYIEKINKKFQPTELGKAVTEMLVKNLAEIINVSFTAKMEEDLDKIASGKSERDNVLLDFYDKFKKDLEKFIEASGGEKKKNTPTEIKCPTCKKENLVIRFGRTGEFVGCPGFPECKFTSQFEKDEDGKISLIKKEPPKTLDLKCPKCESNLIERKGRFGPFAACPGFPKCRYIHREEKK